MEVSALKPFENQHVAIRWQDGFEAVVWLYAIDDSNPGREVIYDLVSVSHWGARPREPVTNDDVVVSSAASIASVAIVAD